MSIENATTGDIVTANTIASTASITTTNLIINSVHTSVTTPIIKHLVIGGGGPFGLTAFGALKYLHEQHFWDIKNIKTIYAVFSSTFLS